MSAPALPPGAERIRRLEDSIADTDEALDGLCDALPQINDPGLRPRVLAFVEGARTTLDRERNIPGPEVADQLNELLNGVRGLAIPARDPELGPTATLKTLEQATGVIAIRLINALESAAELGWKPRVPELPERLTANVSREEAGTLLDRIADRLDALKSSLDQLVSASADAPRRQQGLVNFYVGSVQVELNLAKMELKIGEKSVDFAALWRASEAIAEFTRDFYATLQAWAQRVSAPLVEAAQTVRGRVRKMAGGVGAALRFVARKRRRDALQPPTDANPGDAAGDGGTAISFAPPPDFEFEEAARMILAGQPPPDSWCPFITSLDLSETECSLLTPLAGLLNLQRLILNFTRVSDLSPLAQLTSLRRLELDDTPVRDISIVAHLTGLQHLGLRFTHISDLSALANLIRLQRLDLNNTDISDLAALAGLIRLTELDLRNTVITDISVLANLVSLRSLNLSRTSTVDVSALAGLAQLEDLNLSETSIRDVSMLAGLTQLEDLNLTGTSISDVSVLASLTSLQALQLNQTQVSDLSILARLTGLRRLGLGSLPISDLSVLVDLTQLEILHLDRTRITDLSMLGGFTELHHLDLERTPVTDVSALASLTSLRHLDLCDTQVSDVAALASLTELTHLDLRNTPVTDISALTTLTRLRSLYLTGSQARDTSSLEPLTELRIMR